MTPNDVRGALERADREDALRSWLDRRRVPEAWRLAAALAAADATVAWCGRVDEVLPGDDLLPALQWVAHTVTVERMLAEVRESTHRVSELVAAVRSYSQMDRASRQAVQVTAGLENTLVMLGHKLRRHHDGAGLRAGPAVAGGYPGELTRCGPT